VVSRDRSPAAQARVAASLAAHGVPLRELHVVGHPGVLHGPLPWRSDHKAPAYALAVRDAADLLSQTALAGLPIA
jgi:hypothetical protein